MYDLSNLITKRALIPVPSNHFHVRCSHGYIGRKQYTNGYIGRTQSKKTNSQRCYVGASCETTIKTKILAFPDLQSAAHCASASEVAWHNNRVEGTIVKDITCRALRRKVSTYMQLAGINLEKKYFVSLAHLNHRYSHKSKEFPAVLIMLFCNLHNQNQHETDNMLNYILQGV